ncbi:MAG: hypothetical protein J7L89_10175 [Bacteroidales bacterium]|nr:hypothetical protein [Bacteroidales bacterium]
MIWFVLASVILGFLTGPLFSEAIQNKLKGFVLPSAFIMLWASMIMMKTEHFIKSFKRPKQLVIGNIMSLIFAPLLMLPIALILAKEPHLYAGLVLAGIAPPGGFVTYWTMLLNANMGLAVSLTLTTFIISLMLIPWGMKLLVGNKIQVNVLGLFYKILILVVGPFILAMLTRWLIVRKNGEKNMAGCKPYFSLISSLMALYLVFAGISVKADFLITHFSIVLLPAAGALLYYLLAYPLSYIILHKWFGFPLFDAIPLIYGTSTKNLSIAMGLAVAAFGPLTLLGVILCMIFQMPLASIWHKIFVKLTN